jgi:Glycosyl transferase family 2
VLNAVPEHGGLENIGPVRAASDTRSPGPGAPNGLPAGSIEFPADGSVVPRTPVIVAGWVLDTEGPVSAGLVLVNGDRATGARLGSTREDIAARYPGTPNAGRSGWDAIIDVRGIQGPTATLTLLARTSAGEWVEIDRSEVRVEEPNAHSGGRRAVFTIAQNEPRFLPLWLDYYRRHFDAPDIYVLDHDSTDGTIDSVADSCNVVAVHRAQSFDHVWLMGTVEDFFSFLLRSYDTVLFAEADELIVPDPSRYPDLGAYIESLREPAACCTGYNVVQYPEEAPLRFDEPVLRQRRYWHPSPQWYSKRLLAKIPLSWNIGFHEEYNAAAVRPDPDLYLIHLHRVDYDYCLARHRAAARREWPEDDLQLNLGWHQRVVEPEEFRNWFFHGEDLEGTEREMIPDRVRDVL